MIKELSVAEVAPLPVTDISHVMKEIKRYKLTQEQIQMVKRYNRMKANEYRQRKRQAL